ncbi:MAG: RsiV family protein [Prevotellaceae bacterium]|nr:RsiV family protein [Prevotellaceae bacterium]
MYRADNAHGISYNCEYVVKTHVDNDNEKYYTYIADTYFYGGGAHGSSFVIVKNINVNTGKIVSLKDIFVPGYEKALCDIIIKKICKKFDAKNLEDLRSKSVFYGIDVYPSQNFIIGEKSITFIYSPDEIAFHAAGEIRVEINNSDIKDILKKQD